MEYHLPLEAQMAALREVLTAIERHRPDVFFPIEARVIDADDAWLSPFHGRVVRLDRRARVLQGRPRVSSSI